MSFIERVRLNYQKVTKPFINKRDKFLEYRAVKKTQEIFSVNENDSFKKTLFLSIFLVFLFYLPFTIATLALNRVMFFQLDHLYQYSTIVFDLQHKILSGDFSTWDWNNAMGYDYFANAYYISLDFSFLPFLIFPTLAYYKVMYISFLLKILVGTAVFAYLLKLYKFSNKTIVFASLLYGSADLFLSQNVFTSFTGVIVYIPLILVAIELIVQKKNYFVLSLVIFQMFLFNFYWSWPLSLFLAIMLFVRLILDNQSFSSTLKTFIKSIFFYLIGVGLAAFFLLPILGIMANEPRGNEEFVFNLMTFLKFDKQVYFKTIFKMLVPNLFAYRGYFHDSTSGYFLPTNHIIIYSSILATYTLFQFILTPSVYIKKKLNTDQFRTYQLLKYTTIVFYGLMMVPAVAFLFSATTSAAYLRYFVFFGVLLIINFAFFYEYKLFNRFLILPFLLGVIGFLYWANRYNDLKHIYSESFHYTDETITNALIVVYIISFAILLIFFKKYWAYKLVFFAEKVALLGLVIGLMMAPGYSSGVRHHAVYGKVMNELLEDFEPQADEMTHHFLFYNDYSDLHPYNNLSYLNQSKSYGASGTFHSLINPFYKPYRDIGHRRLYRPSNIPFLYYLYLDPSSWVISQDKGSTIKNAMHDPSSVQVGYKDVDEFNSYVALYQKEKEMPFGVGFTKFLNPESNSNHKHSWLDAIYIKDEETRTLLIDEGFTEHKGDKNQLKRHYQLPYAEIPRCEDEEQEDACPYDLILDPYLNYPGMDFGRVSINVTKEMADYIYVEYSAGSYEAVQALIGVDGNGNWLRSYTNFIHVPEEGIKEVIIGGDGHYIAKNSAIYTLKKDTYESAVDKFKRNSTYEVKIDGNRIDSRVKTEEPVIMNYKVGYAPGWQVFVDGEEVPVFEGHGGLVSFLLMEPGDYEVILQYNTPGLARGAKISLISLILFSVLFILYLFRNKLKYYKDLLINFLDEHDYNPIKITKALLKDENAMEFMRFVIIGVIATLISYGIYRLSLPVMHRNFALTLGYIISFGFNFYASNAFTFKTKPTVEKGYRFLIAHGINYVNQLVLLNLFVFIGLSEKLAIIPTYLICIPVNYLFVRYALKPKTTKDVNVTVDDDLDLN